MENINSDVIVIGAGIAGLAAFQRLHAAGLQVTILEARDRLGGRIYTVRPAGLRYPIELGAEFVHGRFPGFWERLDLAGVRLNDTCVNHWTSLNGVLKFEADYYSLLETFFTQLEQHVTQTDNDMTLEDFTALLMQRDPTMSNACQAAIDFIENYLAASRTKVGIKFLAQGEAAAQSIGTEALQVLDGYDHILAPFLQCDNRPTSDSVHFNTVVKTINWQPGQVTVIASKTSQEEEEEQEIVYTAARALITVPLGVLKARPPAPGAIVFCPPLEQKQKAIDGLAMGTIERVVVTFTSRFWEDLKDGSTGFPEFGFIHCAEAPIAHWWSQFPVRSPVLIGWISAVGAGILPEDPVLLRASVIKSLTLVFGMKRGYIEEQLIDCHYHDWGRDPYAQGAYSYQSADAGDMAHQLAAPVEETLFFAGEATECSGFTGTVHGAMKTGLRAADEVLLKFVCRKQ